MAENGNGEKKYLWWKTINLTSIVWYVIAAICGWALWTTRRSDALERTAASNINRITAIEKNMPEIQSNLASINTNIEWIKRNLK